MAARDVSVRAAVGEALRMLRGDPAARSASSW